MTTKYACVGIKEEFGLVLDRFIDQERLSELGLPEKEIINPRLSSRVVSDAVTDGPRDESDGLDESGGGGTLSPEQEKAIIEVAAKLRQISAQYDIDKHQIKACDPNDGDGSPGVIPIADLPNFVDANVFNDFVDKLINHHDEQVRQVAQVAKVTTGVLKWLRNANQLSPTLMRDIRQNATNYLYERFGGWVGEQGGMAAAVHS